MRDLLLAGCATINTLMAAVPRIIYGMALDGALPRFSVYSCTPALKQVIAIAFGVAIPCLHARYLNGDIDHIVPPRSSLRSAPGESLICW